MLRLTVAGLSLVFLTIPAAHAESASDLADRAAFFTALNSLCPGLVPQAAMVLAVDRTIAAAGGARDDVIEVIVERSLDLQEKVDDEGKEILCHDVRQGVTLEGDEFWR